MKGLIFFIVLYSICCRGICQDRIIFSDSVVFYDCKQEFNGFKSTFAIDRNDSDAIQSHCGYIVIYKYLDSLFSWHYQPKSTKFVTDSLGNPSLIPRYRRSPEMKIKCDDKKLEYIDKATGNVLSSFFFIDTILVEYAVFDLDLKFSYVNAKYTFSYVGDSIISLGHLEDNGIKTHLFRSDLVSTRAYISRLYFLDSMTKMPIYIIYSERYVNPYDGSLDNCTLVRYIYIEGRCK